jgi:hypothetical protein
MSERPDRDASGDPTGLPRNLRTAQTVGGLIVKAAVLFVTVVVFLQIFGVIDAFDDDITDPERVQRLPAEFLYLDDERVDAYLGQLRGGLAQSERQSVSVRRSRKAELALQQVVQVGGSVAEQRLVQRTVESRAADRYYALEAELAARFGGADRPGLRFKSMEARAGGCRQIARGVLLRPGQIVRILGAQLRVPTYAAALAKVAHASQFVAPEQSDKGVAPERLSRLAELRQADLRRFVRRFGTDPRLPFRVEFAGRDASCTIFIPARYSNLVDAPSLLTGKVTVVGKIVRLVLGQGREYFDVETAARYGRAVRSAEPAVKEVLALARVDADEVINASARVSPPALVVLPIAIYK